MPPRSIVLSATADAAALTVLMVLTVLTVAGCATSATSQAGSDDGKVLTVTASINAWGSMLAQLGGSRVRETSIITNPDTDPHSYEPTPADARAIAGSQLFVENGIGYDPWAAQALAASRNSARVVIDVGQVSGIAVGGNPHRWYSPSDVEKVADAITAGLIRLDPGGAGYFDSQRHSFEATGLAQYHQLIKAIKARYAGTPVGASESIFAPLSDALGLDLLTPASFLKAISEGADPSATDKATIDAQISEKKIKAYVVNTQNSTPDVAAQVAACRKRGIPVTGVTETLSPASASFQDWQAAQLRSLQSALSRAAGT
jgi:zinc/manganese transport system substrate-binding protein